jgi:hypothetical protein
MITKKKSSTSIAISIFEAVFIFIIMRFNFEAQFFFILFPYFKLD